MKLFCYPVLILALLSCALIRVNVEPIAATVTELSTCLENGEQTEVFSPEDEYIFACGHIQSLQPVDIKILWYYEDKLIFQQDGKDMNGDFHSFIQPGNNVTFPIGKYRVDVLIGGVVAKSVEFRVE
jgi:hypothetical protein